MKHLFLTSGSTPASWRESFPDALVQSAASPELARANILWYRLRLGEVVETAVASLRALAELPLVVMSDQPQEAEVLRAIAAGAVGYCNTHAAPEVLRQVAVVVANGGLWIGPTFLQHMVGGAARALMARKAVATEWTQSLSEREQEVARRVAVGASNKEIAQTLAITERTVKAHLGAIFDKLGVRDRLQLSLRVNGVHI